MAAVVMALVEKATLANPPSVNELLRVQGCRDGKKYSQNLPCAWGGDN